MSDAAVPPVPARSLGATVRRLFGRHERAVAEAWRSAFVDLDALVADIRAVRPDVRRILEVGCGEGALSERLVAAWPEARLLGIDVAATVGRLYAGDPARAGFRRMPLAEVAAAEPAAFDLVVMGDVLHHVPPPARRGLLAEVAATLAPGGLFVFKDWARAATPIHFACWASDRFLTGDDVAFLAPDEARALLADVFGETAVAARPPVRPWSNNYVFHVRA